MGRHIFNSLPGILINDTQHCVNRASQGFLCSPACEHFCSTIDKGDAAVRICGNHRIADARQGDLKPIPLLDQRLLGPLPLG